MLDVIDNPAGTASVAVMVQEGLYTVENAEMPLQFYLNLVQAFADNWEVPAGEPQMFNMVDIEHSLKMGQGNYRFLHFFIVMALGVLLLAEDSAASSEYIRPKRPFQKSFYVCPLQLPLLRALTCFVMSSESR